MSTRAKNQQFIESYLKRNGVIDKRKVAEIISGFDLDKPVYATNLEPEDHLFQFMGNEQSGRPVAQTGNWFCISRGTTKESLAIFDGLAGRRRQEFIVQRHMQALEGTAAPLARQWAWAGGGAGGATQIYLPAQALLGLAGVGTHMD